MDVKWLHSFLSLFETRNFTRTAKKLNMSQAALSRRIQSLESWAGKTLIDRSTKPVQFTPEGLLFHHEATEILSKLSNARLALLAPELGAGNHVRIAIPHILSTSRFTSWWKHWSKNSNMTVSISVSNVTEAVVKFISGDADILLCHSGQHLPMMLNTEQYESHILEQDTLMPFVSRDLINDKGFKFPGTEANPVPLLMYTKGAYFAHLVDMIFEHAPQRIKGARQVESDMSNILLNCAHAGLGVAWLPECAIEPVYKDAIISIGGKEWSMNLSICAYVNRQTTNPACQRLWSIISTIK